MAEGPDLRTGPDRHAGAEHHVRLDQRIRLDDGIMREEHGLRRDEGNARLQRFPACAGLEDRFRLGKARFGIAADQVCFRATHRPAPQPLGAGEADQVRQVVFALGVLVRHLLQQAEHLRRVAGHDAGIAQRHL